MKFKRFKRGTLDFVNTRTRIDKIKKNSEPTFLFNKKFYPLEEYAIKYYESLGYNVVETGDYIWTRMLTIFTRDIFRKFRKISDEKGFKKEFYDHEHFTMCRKEIIKRFNNLKTTNLIREIYDTNEPFYNKEKMSLLIKKLDDDQILKILYDLINNYSNKKTGFPRLFVYNDTDAFFSVVKANNDDLSAKEVRKEEVFIKTGIDVQILGINKQKNWKKHERDKFFNKDYYDSASFKEIYEHKIKNTEYRYKLHTRNNLTDVESYFINNYGRFTFLGYLNITPKANPHKITVLTDELIQKAYDEGNKIRRLYNLSRGSYFEQRGLYDQAIKQYRKVDDYFGYSKLCDCYHDRREYVNEINLTYDVINNKTKLDSKYLVNFKRRANAFDNDKKLVSTYKTNQKCPKCGSEMVLTVLHDKNNLKYFKCLNGTCYQYGGIYRGNLHNFEKISDVVEYKKDNVELPNIDMNVNRMSDKEKESHKNRLNKQGHDYIQNNEYDEAIIFYESLLTNPLFKNDIKPYRVLSELYQERNEPYNDVKTLTKFFKAGIDCKPGQFRWFKDKIMNYSKEGHIKVSRIKQLQNEYNQKTGKIVPKNKLEAEKRKAEAKSKAKAQKKETKTKTQSKIEITDEDLKDDSELIITKLDPITKIEKEKSSKTVKTEKSDKTKEPVVTTTKETEETPAQDTTTKETEETQDTATKETVEKTENVASEETVTDEKTEETVEDEKVEEEPSSVNIITIETDDGEENENSQSGENQSASRLNRIIIKTDKATKKELENNVVEKPQEEIEETPKEETKEKDEETPKEEVKEKKEEKQEPSPYDGIDESELMKTAGEYEDKIEYKHAIEIYEYLVNKSPNYDAAIRLRICYRRMKFYKEELELIYDCINNDGFDQNQKDYFKKRLNRFEFKPTSPSSSSFYTNNVEIIETNEKCPRCGNNVVVKMIERRGDIKYYCCSDDDCYWYGGEYTD